jgi:hypothetical protein
MTQEQKDLLKPFAEIIAKMHIRLAEMDPSEQRDLLQACRAARPHNCWCLIWDATRLLQPELERLLRPRTE